MKHYEFIFEDGSRYYGTIADKNELVRNLTKREREEMGKIISKRLLTDAEWAAWNEKLDEFMETL